MDFKYNPRNGRDQLEGARSGTALAYSTNEIAKTGKGCSAWRSDQAFLAGNVGGCLQMIGVRYCYLYLHAAGRANGVANVYLLLVSVYINQRSGTAIVSTENANCGLVFARHEICRAVAEIQMMFASLYRISGGRSWHAPCTAHLILGHPSQ